MKKISVTSAISLVLILSFSFLSCSLQPAGIPAVKDKQTETNTPEVAKPAITKALEDREVPRLKVGDKAPQFTLLNVDGKSVSLADFKGKKVIINMFWLECHGCVDEMPYFEEFFQKHTEEVALLAISVYDSEKMVKAFIEAKGLTFNFFVDSAKKLDRAYVIAGVPTTFFIDQDGVVRAITDGGFENVAEIDALYNSY